jgi:hypothetical protein
MAPLLVHEGVRRDGFLATLGSRTWRARAHAACALGDLQAVSGRAAYAGWLSRTATAWSRLPLPPLPLPLTESGDQPWPLLSVGPECLGGQEELAADLVDLGGRAGPADAGGRHGGVDEAFLVAAAHVAVVAAGDAAVLADAAVALAEGPDGPVGTRFLVRCRELARSRPGLRRELAAWAADRDSETAERAVLAAQALTLDLAESLRS